MKRLHVSDVARLAGERRLYDIPNNPNRFDLPLGHRDDLIRAAVSELRASDFSLHEYRVLEGVLAPLSGEEREVMERVFQVVEPRKTP